MPTANFGIFDKEELKAETALILLRRGPVAAARHLALAAFGPSTDSGGDLYFNHLERVALGIKEERARPAGYLHDLIEDVRDASGAPVFSFEDLYEIGFGAYVVEGVRIVTKADEDPYFDEMVKVGRHPCGIQVKLSDLTDNSNLLRLARIPTDKDIERSRKYYLAHRYLTDVSAGKAAPGTPFAAWMAAQPPERQNWSLLAKYSTEKFMPPACRPDPRRPQPPRPA
jgi:hypothetical protein